MKEPSSMHPSPTEDRAARSIPFLRVALRRLSLRGRLTLGFGLIGVLFLIADYVSQKDAVSTAKHIRQTVETNRQFDHAAHSLADAVASYHRRLRASVTIGARTPSNASLAEADAALSRAVAEYVSLTMPIPDSVPSAELEEAVRDFRVRARSLMGFVEQRERALDRYWAAFDRLQSKFAESRRNGWTVGDRIVTRRSLVSTAEALLRVRSAASEYFASPTAQRALNIDQRETRFLAVLNDNEKNLLAAEGTAWTRDVKNDFERLQIFQRQARTATSNVDAAAIVVSSTVEGLFRIVSNDIGTPAVRALSDSVEQAASMMEQMRRRVGVAGIAVLCSVLLISLLTASSVTRPVRRLIAATRTLALGHRFARVPRGGVRELDQLAVAFNELSDRLTQAECEVREQQSQLERRVVERTQQLAHLAYHDVLTQLPNRRGLFEHLTVMFETARRENSAVALLLLDVDNFKTLNDGLGHLFGDRVLTAIGQRLLAAVEPGGIAARLGGDEFTLAVRIQEGSRDLAALTELLLSIFEQPLRIDDREVLVGVSVGASLFPDHASDVESLVSMADGALFKAKSLGRNRACVASNELSREISSQFPKEQALRRALQCDELELFYQPQIDLASGEVNAVEALLRWKRDGSYVLPADFLPLADQTGLIADITDWAMEHAIETLAEWRHGFLPSARVAVNISAQQMIDATFAKRLQELLVKYDVPAAAIELELTETTLQTGAATVRALAELRSLGVGIALDDFGTGFSSLASLDKLPLSRVKIDRSLIANIDSDARSASIARSIIELCRSLQLRVTVEGVERIEQLRRLRDHKDIDVQGYLISQPMSADEIVDVCANLPRHLFDARPIAALQDMRASASPIAAVR